MSYRPSLTTVVRACSETQLDYNQIFLQTYGFDEDIMKVISAHPLFLILDVKKGKCHKIKCLLLVDVQCSH